MSSINFVEVAKINSLRPHPAADRLEIATIHAYETVVPKGMYQVGQVVVYFPPDMLITEGVAKRLGVKNYLKGAIYPGDTKSSRCRVAAARLRGVPSYGFVTAFDPLNIQARVGDDLSDYFGAVKYQPPEPDVQGDEEKPDALFHTYTNIQNYSRYPSRVPLGTQVRITEKVHGMNCRVGVVKTGSDSFEFMCGSHSARRKQGFYWEPLDVQMMKMLCALCAEEHTVIVFGELFGPGTVKSKLKNMYGLTDKQFRVFDISIDGRYLDWKAVESYCQFFGIKTVPLLYKGPFTHECLNLAYGPSCIGGELREGIVITPLTESVGRFGARMILKYISADYLART